MFLEHQKSSVVLCQHDGRGSGAVGQKATWGKGVLAQCGHPGVQKVRTRQHKKRIMKTVTKDETASHDHEVETSDVAPIVDIAIFMKQPFTETDFLDEK